MQPTRARYGVLALTLLLAALAYLDRACINMTAKYIQADLGLSKMQMSYVFSAFTFAYALFEIPSGWLADRFGPRLMLTRIVVWWSIMTAVTGLAGGLISLFIIRLLFGAGEAGTYPGISRAYSRWFSEKERGRAFAIVIMTGHLGGAFTPPLVAALLGATTWRWCFAIFGSIGFFWAVAWYGWFRNDPREHRGVNAAEIARIGNEPPVPHRAVPWGNLFRDRNVIGLCLMYVGVVYGLYFHLTWLPTYLQEARGFDLKQTGWLASLPLAFLAAGVFTGGFLSDWLARRWGSRRGRCGLGFVGLPLAAASVVASVLCPSPVVSVVLLALAAGFSGWSFSPAWTVCLEIGGRHAGVVTGTMNMMGNLGGTLSPVVIGYCVERFHSWDFALLTMALCYLLASACWLLVDPSRPIRDA
jgi:MFS family permease